MESTVGQVGAGKTPEAPEAVDTGAELGGQAFEGGRHMVGADSKVLVLPNGEVHVTYQDATAGTLRHAVGIPAGGQHTWTVSAVPQQGFSGAFSAPVLVEGELRLLSRWRTGGQDVRGDVRVVAAP